MLSVIYGWQDAESKQLSSVTHQKEASSDPDTLTAVKKIIANKSKYLDKELAVLLNELPVSVKSYRTKNHNFKEMDGIMLSFYDTKTTHRMQGRDDVIVKPIYIFINWKTPVPVEKHRELWVRSAERGKWNTDVHAYYSEQIVGSIDYSAQGRQ